MLLPGQMRTVLGKFELWRGGLGNVQICFKLSLKYNNYKCVYFKCFGNI